MVDYIHMKTIAKFGSSAVAGAFLAGTLSMAETPNGFAYKVRLENGADQYYQIVAPINVPPAKALKWATPSVANNRLSAQGPGIVAVAWAGGVSMREKGGPPNSMSNLGSRTPGGFYNASSVRIDSVELRNGPVPYYRVRMTGQIGETRQTLYAAVLEDGRIIRPTLESGPRVTVAVSKAGRGWTIYAMALSTPLYAQQATPAPTPATATATAGALDAKQTKEVKKVAEQPKPPEPRFKLYGWIEAGLTGNPDPSIDNHNFGRLFTDRANEPLLNQMVITGERALDPNATGFDWGFKVQFMYGSDARYIHSLGLLDDTTDQRVQPDFPEVYASAYIPIPSTGGLNLKVGKFATLEGAETIDPRTNVFYTHTYIFNFGNPVNNTGFQSVLHVNKYLDLYAGINRGVNTSLADNNASISFEGGIGLNLLDGNLTTLAVTHAGPEDPGNNHDYRYLNEITTTWKVNKCLTSITDLNLIYDTLGNGKWGGGGAQYLTYSANDWLQLGFRGEIWRDSAGFYVAQFRANNDFLHIVLQGRAVPFDPSNLGGGDTTYLALTGGVTIKPPFPKPFAGLLIRPELRYDRALTTSFKPFEGNTSRDQWTIGFDVVLQF